MPDLNRRDFLKAALASCTAGLRAVEAAAKPVRIRDVDLFQVEIPVSKAEAAARVYNSFRVVKIATDAGVNGYSFIGPPLENLPALRQLLVGKDVFAVEDHLKHGLGKWGGVEHALWDAIGRIGRQPVYRLLGGNKTSAKAYLTCVWKSYLDPTSISFDDQVAMAVKVRDAGYPGMKIQAWRPRPMDNVEVVAAMRAAVGPGLAILVDRTAHAPNQVGQKVWDYETGAQVARGLEKAGAYWLEEPYARDDYESPARLAASIDMPITGGEGYNGIEPFRRCMTSRTYDIVNPDAANAGGILTTRKIAMLAEAFHVPVVQHGSIGLAAMGWLQATFAIGCEWQEFVTVWAPAMPDELLAPGLKLLRGGEIYAIRNGEVQAPEFPGLGLDLDEEALARYRKT